MTDGVLVTGATTPLGRRLCAALLAERRGPVLAVGAEPASSALGLPRDERLVYRRVDLARSRDVHDLLFGVARELGVRTIVHRAVHRSAHDAGARVHRLNVESTRELLVLAERHPSITRVVFVSSADVYRVDADQPVLVGEDHPLQLEHHATQRLRDRVEADVTACMRMGMSRVGIVVLRLAELYAPECGSQLHDYLSSRVCFRPLGFDPMLGVLALDDAVHAIVLAIASTTQGIFNVPGRDVLPLSAAIRAAGRVAVPVPGPLLAPAYWLRARAGQGDFRYDLNRLQLHFSGVLDGRRAREVLGYEPRTAVDFAGHASCSTSADDPTRWFLRALDRARP